MITNRMGTVFNGSVDNPFIYDYMRSLVQNAYLVRSDMLSSALHSRKDINKECDYPETTAITIQNYKDMYDRNPIGYRAVTVMAEECWQTFPELYEDEDETEETEFEAAFKKLGNNLFGEESWFEDKKSNPIWAYLYRADRLCGIGHYSLIIVGTDDGKELDKPAEGFRDNEPGELVGPVFINNDKAPNRKLAYLTVVDESQVSTVEYDNVQYSQRYRKPKYYTIDFGGDTAPHAASMGRESRTLRVHWSRVIHVCLNSDSSDIIGVPDQRPIWNNLLDLMKIYGGGAEGFWRGCITRVFFETNPQLGGDVTVDNEALKTMMWNMENGLQKWGSLMGMQAKTIAPQSVDPTNHINVQIEAICIQKKIPKRVFMGSERGELSSAEDQGDWNDTIRGRQNNKLIPRLVAPFINRLIQLKILPKPADTYKVAWPDPDMLGPLEKATLALTIVDIMAKYIAGQVESLVDPMDLMSKILGEFFDEDEAKGMLERASASQVDGVDHDAEMQIAKVDAGLMVDPVAKAEEDMKIKQEAAKKGVPPGAGGKGGGRTMFGAGGNGAKKKVTANADTDSEFEESKGDYHDI